MSPMWLVVEDFLEEVLNEEVLTTSSLEGVVTLPMGGCPDRVAAQLEKLFFSWGYYGHTADVCQ